MNVINILALFNPTVHKDLTGYEYSTNCNVANTTRMIFPSERAFVLQTFLPTMILMLEISNALKTSCLAILPNMIKQCQV